MYKLLRIALLTAPLAGGVAWAQGSGTNGSAAAPGNPSQSVTDDTRTPVQQKAGRMDDTMPALPGDATKPVDVPNTVRDSDRSGVPDATGMTTPGSQSTDKKVHRRRGAIESDKTKSDPTTKIENRSDTDLQRDQLDSDK
ncbi:MAG: hypothetical protein LC659_08855 [Myxococcales bacterium]|nr:hypothetical protein [Myxococcales bacterium]